MDMTPIWYEVEGYARSIAPKEIRSVVSSVVMWGILSGIDNHLTGIEFTRVQLVRHLSFFEMDRIWNQ